MVTLDKLAHEMGLTHVCGDTDREICGCYAGDLLSWVMSHAKYGHVWITIMSNINVAAVASLSDVACVILSDGVTLESDVLAVCKDKGVNVLSSELDSYNTAIKISGMV